jgi:hypothetical protein
MQNTRLKYTVFCGGITYAAIVTIINIIQLHIENHGNVHLKLLFNLLFREKINFSKL